jgi:uncharacterized protein (TIGR03437 family)
MSAFEHLPVIEGDSDLALQDERARERVIALNRLAALCAQSPAVITDVVNAATKERSFAPGTVIDVIGSNLGTDPRTVTASVSGLRARVISASATRWTIVIPVTLQPGPATVDIGLSNTFNIALTAFAPGLFTADGTGKGIPSAWGFRLNQNGALIEPGYALSATTPAKLGDVLVLMATGLGAVSPPVANGQNSLDQLRTADTTPTVLIGGVPAQVIFAGLSPQFVGVNQINATIVSGTPTGDAVPLQLQVGGITTTDKVTMAISGP